MIAPGPIGFWQACFPEFGITAWPLCDLLESSAAWAWAVTHEAFLFINAQCLRVSGYGPHNTKSLCIGHTERGYQQGLEQQAPDKAQLITPLHLDEKGGEVPGHGVCLGKILCWLLVQPCLIQSPLHERRLLRAKNICHNILQYSGVDPIWPRGLVNIQLMQPFPDSFSVHKQKVTVPTHSPGIVPPSGDQAAQGLSVSLKTGKKSVEFFCFSSSC